MAMTIDSPEFLSKLEFFNEVYDGKPEFQIQATGVNGQLVLDGQLRIYWGILHPILFKEKDDELESILSQRHSYSPDVINCHVIGEEQNSPPVNNGNWHVSPEYLLDESGRLMYGNVVMRNNRKKRRSRKRLSIINGHIYNTETSVFKPYHGSVTSVTVTSVHSTDQVIKLLLDKFKVENNPIEFCLCAVKTSGETRKMTESDKPLLERVKYGPLEDDVKIFIIEKYRMIDINEEVAQFVNLPEAVLSGFLDKYTKDEEMELEMIKEKYKICRDKIEECLENLTALVM